MRRTSRVVVIVVVVAAARFFSPSSPLRDLSTRNVCKASSLALTSPSKYVRSSTDRFSVLSLNKSNCERERERSDTSASSSRTNQPSKVIQVTQKLKDVVCLSIVSKEKKLLIEEDRYDH